MPLQSVPAYDLNLMKASNCSESLRILGVMVCLPRTAGTVGTLGAPHRVHKNHIARIEQLKLLGDFGAHTMSGPVKEDGREIAKQKIVKIV